jgi:hypothetical protein
MKLIYVLAAALVLAAPAAVQGGISMEIGKRMPDGTVYAGVSPATRTPTYTTPNDAPGIYSSKKGVEYCTVVDAGGHKDWRVPTKGELNMLYNNRAAIGGFNEAGLVPSGWYLSSSQGDADHAWAQRFSNGRQVEDYLNIHSSLRCVR